MMLGGLGNCWYTVFIAARFLVDQEEYDEAKDPRVLAANKQGLEVWGVRPRSTAEDPDVDESKLILLIGKKLALIGDGGDDSARIPADELLKHIQETKTRLLAAEIKEKPALWAHCDIDLGD